MNAAARVAFLATSLVACAIACGTTNPHVVESWAADLTSLQEVFFMSFERTGNTVQGSGTISPLTNFNVVQVSLTGTRNADTLDITYVRPDSTRLHFIGHYALNGQVIIGTLSGGGFNNTGALFRNH